MSLSLNFEPYAHYMGWAIKKNDPDTVTDGKYWEAFIDDGNTYTVLEQHGTSLKQLKERIKITSLIHHLTKEQAWNVVDIVHDMEFNPEHPDDTFNAGVWDVFYTYDHETQLEIITKAKETV